MQRLYMFSFYIANFNPDPQIYHFRSYWWVLVEYLFQFIFTFDGAKY